MLRVSFLAFSDHDLEDERHSNDIIHVEAAAGTPMSSAQRYGLRYSLVKNPEQVLNVSNYSQHPQVRMQKVTQLSNHQSSNHLSYIEYHMSSHILFSCGVNVYSFVSGHYIFYNPDQICLLPVRLVPTSPGSRRFLWKPLSRDWFVADSKSTKSFSLSLEGRDPGVLSQSSGWNSA